MAKKKRPAARAPVSIADAFARAAGWAPPSESPKARKPPRPEQDRVSRGKVVFDKPLRINSPRGKRPDVERIKAWIARRKHIKHWRNRDGSYDAIVTVHGSDAWDVIRNLLLSAPRRCYVSVRYYVWQSAESFSKDERTNDSPPNWDEYDAQAKRVKVPHSSPTVRARRESVDFALSFPYARRGTDLVETIAGAAFYWPAK